MGTHNKNDKGFSTVEAILLLVIVALVAVIGFMVYNHKAKTVPASGSSTVSQTANKSSGATAINPIIDNGNYRGLVPYMAASLTVVKEGTNAGGTDYSSAAAVATISDFYGTSNNSNGAALPWDFTGDGAYKSMAQKSTGAVKAYIAQGHIAVSKNNWVLAYNLNSDQKISSFYMSPSVNLSK